MQPELYSTSERWRRLEDLFNQAVERDPKERPAFLDEACGTDFELRTEVESLLAHSNSVTNVLEKAVHEAAQSVVRSHPAGIAPGTYLDQYQVIEKVGSGGMGQVYLAQDLRLRRRVALKVLPPALTHDAAAFRRFEQEAQAVSALNHPNILTIYNFGEVDGLQFIVTEFVEGQTLRQMLNERRLKEETAVEVGIQVAAALAAAHSQGIIHRDIKPENMIMRADGLVKVLDFGIAKLVQPQEQAAATGNAVRQTSFPTRPGSILGTPQYMSPEQARGLPVDGRTDIFSLGAVLYEIIAERPPFEGETRNDIIAEILKSDPVPLVVLAPEVPEPLEKIIVKSLQKDRESRYRSAEELLNDLQDFKRQTDFRRELQRASSHVTPDQFQQTAAGAGTSLPIAEQAPEIAPGESSWSLIKRIALVVAILILVSVIGYIAVRKFNPGFSSTRPPSLAVLPFRNIKQDPQTEFLGFSLADAVITKLGYINALTVRPSSSIDKYRNQVADLRKIAADLGVDMLLTGGFIKEGDELRITIQLVRIKSNTILWRDTFDVRYDKLLAVQDRVAQLIIKGLELQLSPAEKQHLKAEAPIKSPAYEYYLRGVDLYSIGNFPLAINMLEKSASLEPNYAPTWAHLGRAYTTNGSLHAGGREYYQKAQAAYEKAITLSPAYPEPRIYMANLFTDTGRVEQAVPLLKEALKSSPNNAEAHWELGYAYRFGGMLEQSAAECELARQLDPEVKINSSALNSYLYLGEYDKFLESLPVNDSSYLLFYRGFGEYHKGNWKQATTYFDRAFETAPSLLPAQVGKALSYSIAHRNAVGHKLLRNLESRINERGVTDAELLYKIAQAYAVLADKPSALRVLQRSIEGGFFCASYFETDPLLSTLHKDPKYEELLRQAHDRQQQFERRFSGSRFAQ
jgi:serine/threonine protein kinase/Flp pilus assembly protein TadD